MATLHLRLRAVCAHANVSEVLVAPLSLRAAARAAYTAQLHSL